MMKRGKTMYNMAEKKWIDNSSGLFQNKKNMEYDLVKFTISTEITQSITLGMQNMANTMTDVIREELVNGRRKQKRK